MSVQLRLTEQAQQDLRDIWRGWAEYSGLELADRRLDEIETKFRLLLQFPNAGRIRDELQSDIRSYPAGEVVIFYRVAASVLEVVRVLHGRRDVESVLQEES